MSAHPTQRRGSPEQCRAMVVGAVCLGIAQIQPALALAQQTEATAGEIAVATAPVATGPRLAFDFKTGAIIAGERIDDLWYPASLTKLMTTYVALDAVRAGRLQLDSLLVASARAASQPPSRIGIGTGGTITLENALRLLIVKSANDIAVTVAEALSGSEEAFAAEMNARAADLGMTRSNWVNAHGLPEVGQVTTARDLALLSRALVTEFPTITRTLRLPYVLMNGNRVASHNLLLGRYDGADGFKTGFICASGFNMVASATRGGRKVGAVVLGEHSAGARKVVAEGLLDQAFERAFFDLGNAPSLAGGRDPAAGNEPVNKRPDVCAAPVRHDVSGLQPAAPPDPPVEVTFGASINFAPLPKPRPRRPEDEIVLVDAQVETAPTVDARPPGDPSIPLPKPRPRQN